MEGPIEMTATRCVAMRELARSAGALVTQVDQDGRTFAVTRNGRIVALLVPLPERLVLEFENASRTSDHVEPTDVEVELAPVEQAIVAEAAATPTGYWQLTDRPNIQEFVAAAVQLELKGLLHRSLDGTRLTKAGRSLANRLARGHRG